MKISPSFVAKESVLLVGPRTRAGGVLVTRSRSQGHLEDGGWCMQKGKLASYSDPQICLSVQNDRKLVFHLRILFH